ncbi:PDZ domain-containing protein [bacterium]|nr:PDZ domain-containing protein [bacterium]MBU1435144.1 PDZ domain-containing protein [bacterium]MBU1502801.1 PDZ domain-containing protein [bacterium]
MKKFTTYKLYNLFLGAIVILTMYGCTTTPKISDPRYMPDTLFNVQVSSFAAPDAVTRAYGGKMFITSAMKNVGDKDLEFIQAAKYIENALSKAYTRVNKAEDADILIRVAYGIGSPQRNYDNVVVSHGYSYPVGWMWFTAPSQTKTVTTTSYHRNLIIEAYWLKDKLADTPIWKTIANSEGSSSDIHTVLPYMIAASYGYMGISSGRQMDVRFNTSIPAWQSLILLILNGPTPMSFVGVGVRISIEGEKIIIIDVLPNTPASKAGLIPGLVIQEIDGMATNGMQLEECTRLLRGSVSSKVKLELIDTANKTITVELTREKIQTI